MLTEKDGLYKQNVKSRFYE